MNQDCINRQELMKSHVPVTHFHYAVNEVKERLKVCLSMGSFIEDIAEAENFLGKVLLKIGSQATLFSKVETHAHGGIVIALWENVYKSFSVQLGKQHSSLQANLVVNIVKAFPESVRALKKTAKSVDASVSASCDEYRRAKTYYRKLLDKYLRMSYEAESLIKSKDSLITNSVGDTEAKANSDMNLSLSKILGKSSQTERKLLDKCNEIMRELETNERTVEATYEKLVEHHDALHADIGNSLCELNNIEISRCLLMKEGLSRMFVAEDLLNSAVENMYQSLIKEVNDSKSKSILPDISAILSDIASSYLSWNDDEALSKFTAYGEKVGDAIDSIKSLATFIRQFCSDISEAGKAYQKFIQKAFEKHGFSKYASPTTSHMRSNNTASTLFTTSYADLLVTTESPSMRLVWEAIVRSIGGFAEAVSNVGESMIEQIANPLESVIRQLDERRRELFEKSSFHSKRVSNGQANVLKVIQKLLKVQKDIGERKTVLKKARDDENNATSGVNPSNQVHVPDNENHAFLRERSLSSSAIQTNETTSKSSIRGAPLSVVVGLESSADRINRLETKIASLEEEEAALIISLESSKSGLYIIFENMKTDMYDTIKVAVEMLLSHTTLTRDYCGVFLDLEHVGMETRKKALNDVRICYDAIDIDRDLFYFTKLIQTTAKAHEEEHKENLMLEIASVDAFKHYQSIILDNERRMNPLSPRDSSPSITDEKMVREHTELTDDDIRRSKLSDDSHELTSLFEGDDNFEIKSPLQAEPLQTQNDSEESDKKADIIESQSTKTVNKESVVTISPEKSLDDGVKSTSIVKASKLPVNLPGTLPTVTIKAQAAAGVVSPSSKIQTSMNKSPAPQAIAQDQTAKINQQAMHIQSKDNEPVSELSKFGLSHQDKILESYSCALYPKKGMLTHGRMYITQNFLAFSGWPDTRVLLSLVDIKTIEKTNTLYYVPNALLVKTQDDEEYFFASFLDRDQCYNLITRIAEVAKRLAELHGPNPMVSERNLTLGFQSNFTSLAGNSTAGAIMNAFSSASSSGVMNSLSEATLTRTLTDGTEIISRANAISPQTIPQETIKTILNPKLLEPTQENGFAMKQSQSNKIEDGKSPKSLLALSMGSKANLIPGMTRSQPEPALPTTQNSDFNMVANQSRSSKNPAVSKENALSIRKLFTQNKIIPLGEFTYPNIPTKMFWDSFWLESKGYIDFLDHMGDFDIAMTEWTECQSKSNIPEDLLKLKFQYTRELKYLHPRTTMLMFGPKDAPGKQQQFLYLPQESAASSNSESLRNIHPWQGVIMTITQFDGIPMCDVFRVVQYWAFEETDNGSDTAVHVGLNLHMVKSSMFKSQIVNGTKEELEEQVKKWNIYMKNLLSSAPHDATESTISTTNDIPILPRSPRLRKSRRRSSLIENVTEMTKAVIHKVTGDTASSSTSSEVSSELFSKQKLLYVIGFLLLVIYLQYSANQSLRRQIWDIANRVRKLEDQTKIFFKNS